MAEPPNGLTELLWYKTPEEMYDILKEKHCLSATTTQNRDQVIALIKETDASFRQLPPMAGPTVYYVIVGALLKASYLSDKARKLLATNTVDQVRKK
jgi:hypothetical protein